MLAFVDDRDGYYEFADDAPPEWYAHLTPTTLRPPVVVPPTPAQQIADLERQNQMPKAVRKFMLTAMETEAIRQGATLGLSESQALALLAQRNPGYAGVKALDNQIEALEALL